MRPFEGNREADVAPGENEFDSPEIKESPTTKGQSILKAMGRSWDKKPKKKHLFGTEYVAGSRIGAVPPLATSPGS